MKARAREGRASRRQRRGQHGAAEHGGLTGTQAEQTLKLLDELEDHDDVQEVASNIDISQEEIERLSAA